MVNFTQFTTFPIFSHRMAHFSPNFKIFISQGVHWPIFPDLQLFKSFPTEVPQNDPQWPILPLKWLGWLEMTNFGQFSTFPIFSHQKLAQIDSEWPILTNLQLSNLFLPMQLIFCQISKFLFLGGWGTSANFPRFATFQIVSN